MRFFAATATINAVLAKLFGGFAGICSRSFDFPSQSGAALETNNLAYAREISRRAAGSAWDRGGNSLIHRGNCLDHRGGSLDHALVCNEQAHLQQYVRAERAQRPQQWEIIRRGLNGLLNGQQAAALVSRLCERSQRLT